MSSFHPPWPSCITRNISNSSCTLMWSPVANREPIDEASLGFIPAAVVGVARCGVAIAVVAVAAVGGRRVAIAEARGGVDIGGAVLVISVRAVEVAGTLRLAGGVEVGGTATGTALEVAVVCATEWGGEAEATVGAEEVCTTDVGCGWGLLVAPETLISNY